MSEEPNRDENQRRNDSAQHQPQGGGQAPQPTAQPQGGQQPAAHAQGRPPQQTQQSFLDEIQRPTPLNYIKGIVGSMTLMGVLLGLGIFLVGEIGGRTLYPSIIQDFSGMPGVSEVLGFTHKLVLAYIANEVAILLVFLMAPVFGFLVAFKMDDNIRAKMGAAGIGVAVGSLLFTVIVIFATSMVVPSAGDLMSAAQSADPTGATTSPSMGMAQGMMEGVDLGSADIGNSVLNGILIGIPAGLGAVAIVYLDDKFFD